MNNSPLIIVGFMGAGKSAIAAAVASKLNYAAIDLDEFISHYVARTPKQIIEQDGEQAFRAIESELLQQVLVSNAARPVVIAAGGGTWTIAANRKKIEEFHGVSIWLNAPFELCWKRIQASDEGRPLAQSLDMARKLYVERAPIYALSNVCISIDERKSVPEVAQQIVDTVLVQNENA
jgi:shikimate kinase